MLYTVGQFLGHLFLVAPLVRCPSVLINKFAFHCYVYQNMCLFLQENAVNLKALADRQNSLKEKLVFNKTRTHGRSRMAGAAAVGDVV